MIVYRFERNGIGPYMNRLDPYRRQSNNPHSQAIVQRVMKQHPYNFVAHSKAHEDKRMMYGCATKELLKVYFGYNLKPLFKQGFRIRTFVVPDDEVIDIGLEVAFPVKYHKLRTKKRIDTTLKKIRGST